ncbi:MAG: TonB-dependent receptor [Gemmatimonadaceae bacterium]|nr:TonB-dependent receptor [Gemmatimonadaceae bacterium]
MFFRRSIALAAVVVGKAAAQAAPHSSAAADTLRARDTLATAVITATRVEVSTAAPTASTTVLLGTALRAQGLTRVTDALKLVPGATVVGGGPVGSVTSLFIRGGNSNYVRVLVDGVPVNDAGGSLDLSNLSLENVDRIEVARGPASVLYGSGAVTGVVQIFTADGTGGQGLRVAASGGSYGTLRASGSLAGGSSAVRYSIGGARDQTAGILPFNNEYRNDVLSGGVRLAPDSATDIRAAVRWSSGNYHYPYDAFGAITDHNSEQLDHRLTASLDAGRQITERVELRATITSNQYLPRTNDAPDGPADTLGYYGYFSRGEQLHRSLDARVNVGVGSGSIITVGGEVSRDKEESTVRSLSQFGNSTDAFGAARSIAGVYAQAIGDITNRVSYVAGVRRDENSAFGVFTTARAALAWLAGPAARVRVSAGNAFRAPSFYENFSTGYVTGNPALHPEESRSVELGSDVTFAGGTLQIAGTAYAQRFHDIIEYVGTVPKPGAPNYYNVAAADANGVELEARWQPSGALAATLAYSLTDTKKVAAGGASSTSGASYANGEPLLRRPRHTLSASLARSFGNGGGVRVQALRIGERADLDYARYPAAAVTLPAYVKVDVSGTIPTAVRGLSLTFRADNLFDARYDDVAGYRAPGATFLGGLSYRR